MEEFCYPRADQLPATPALGSHWTLVDAASHAARGIQKFGILSTTVGDVLRLRPPAFAVFTRSPVGKEPFECMFPVYVTLGFFASHLQGQGRFELSCEGCSCVFPAKAAIARFLRRGKFAPHISTVAAEVPGLGINASVTAPISFLAALTPQDGGGGDGCVLRIEHLSHSTHALPAASEGKVRIDNLFIRRASQWDERSFPNVSWGRNESTESTLSPMCQKVGQWASEKRG